MGKEAKRGYLGKGEGWADGQASAGAVAHLQLEACRARAVLAKPASSGS